MITNRSNAGQYLFFRQCLQAVWKIVKSTALQVSEEHKNLKGTWVANTVNMVPRRPILV